MEDIILKSENITIRPMKSADVKFFTTLRNKCVKFLHTGKKYTVAEAYIWFKKAKPGYFIIEYLGESAGYIRTSEWDFYSKNVYIGADIEPKFRKKGIATEAYEMFIGYLFKKMKFNKVSLEVLDFNVAALSLYKKLGFKKEGVRKHHVRKGKKYVDSVIMSRINTR